MRTPIALISSIDLYLITDDTFTNIIGMIADPFKQAQGFSVYDIGFWIARSGLKTVDVILPCNQVHPIKFTFYFTNLFHFLLKCNDITNLEI